jgi:hypothetical protein
MFTNGFSIEIISDRINRKKINNEIVYAIPHRTYYKIKLGNQTHHKCVVVLFIDGKRMGAFEVEAMNTILVDRPVFKYMPFNFIFEKENSYNPNSKDKKGIFEAVFLPEKTTPVSWKMPKPNCTCVKETGCSKNYLYDNLLPAKDYNIESYVKINHNKDSSNHLTIYPKKEDFSDEKTTIIMKVIEDTEYIKPFVSKLAQQVADNKHIAQLNIPKVRQYDDFFFMTQALPY